MLRKFASAETYPALGRGRGMDRSKRDPRADSEMPRVPGGVHRALDRTRTFRRGSGESASALNDRVRDFAGISGC